MTDTRTTDVLPAGAIALNITPRQLYFVVAFVAALLSKGGALYPAYSPDDYFFAFSPVSNATSFVPMGRSLGLLLSMGANALGITFASIQFFAFWLSLAAFAWYAAITVDLVAHRRVSKWVVAGCIAVMAAHPYLSTYYVFRMSMFSGAIVFAVAAWGLSVLVHEDRTSIRRVLYSAVIVAIFCNLSQRVLLLYVVGGLAWALASICKTYDTKRQWTLPLFRPLVLTVISAMVATVLYFALGSLVRHVMGVAANETYTPHMTGGWLGTAKAQWKLVWYALVGNEPVFPSSIKIGCAALAVVALCRLKRDLAHWAAAGLILAVGGWIVATLPMTFSWHGYVPRTFFSLGPVMGLTYLMLAGAWQHPTSRLFSAGLFVLAGIFCLLSSSMFFEQKIMTQWDQTLARSIFSDASSQGLLGKGELRIVAHWPVHSPVISMYEPGVNESAFQHPWTYKNLFLVATGAKVNVGPGPMAACKNKPHWPQPGYLFRGSDGNVYACVN